MKLAHLLQLLPPETAHRTAVEMLSLAPHPAPAIKHDPRLAVSIAGLDFPNPLGLAAGFDKNAEAIGGAFGLGFGHVEAGTITPRPQPGNPRPRVFRLTEDKAVINRYGFNSRGMDAAARNLARFRKIDARRKQGGILGINIGANKDSRDRIADYRIAAKTLAHFADYLTVNVSSPNTPDLRGLQEASLLDEVLAATHGGMAKMESPPPLFLKLSPDLDRQGLEAACGVARKHCAAIIIANTTIARPGTLKSRHAHEAGGLSGAPLFLPATEMLVAARRILPRDFPLIAAGGVGDSRDAYAKILAGASLVQIYTALALGHAPAPRAMLAGLAALLARDGYDSVMDACGKAADAAAAIAMSRA